MTPFDKLSERAEMVRSDISGDFPEVDANYNLWCEELRDSRGVRVTYGVIEMGDVYNEVFEWDGKEWHRSTEGDPFRVVDRIIAKRGFR